MILFSLPYLKSEMKLTVLEDLSGTVIIEFICMNETIKTILHEEDDPELFKLIIDDFKECIVNHLFEHGDYAAK